MAITTKKRGRSADTGGKKDRDSFRGKADTKDAAKRQKQTASSGGGAATGRGKSTIQDPSLQYLADPTGAPICVKAREFFAGKLPKKRGEFKIRVGATKAWRTVSKLHVRTDYPYSEAVRSRATASFEIKNELAYNSESELVRRDRKTTTRWSRRLDTICGVSEAARATEKFVIKRSGASTCSTEFHIERQQGQLEAPALGKRTEDGAADGGDGEHHAEKHKKHKQRNRNATACECRIGMISPGANSDLQVLDISRTGSEAHHPVLDGAITLVRRCVERAGVPDFRSALQRGEDVEIEGRDPTPPGPRVPHEDLKDASFGRTNSDTLRYVFFGVERSTNRAQITLVWNSNDFAKCPNLGALVHEIVSHAMATGNRASGKNHAKIHSLWVHGNRLSIHSNSFFEEAGPWQCVLGSDCGVREKLLPGNAGGGGGGTTGAAAAAKLHLPPTVFRQANLKEFAQIVSRVRECVKKGDKLLELYGGVGTIGLQLLDLLADYECSDANPFNENCFRRSVTAFLAENAGKASASTPGDGEAGDGLRPWKLDGNIRYVSKAATEMVGRIREGNFDTVIVDPPRKGLDAEVVEALVEKGTSKASPSGDASPSPLKRLIYISCGFSAFTRDCEKLVKGGWKLDRAEGFVLFPGADHVETFASFVKA
eukprot:g13634.t1